jgi:hypothetical protein
MNMNTLPLMSAATLMQQIRILPEKEKEALYDALWREDREALLDRLEEEQDMKDADAVLNDPNTEWVPWEEVKRTLAWE